MTSSRAHPGERHAGRVQFARVCQNPTLFPGLAQMLGPDFPWHSSAGSTRSSQAFCLSAWVPLQALPARHQIIETLLTQALPALPHDPGRIWDVDVEVRRPELLGEHGGFPSSIDVVLQARDVVVCVESKYLSDAQSGFGRCGQFPGDCAGYYGAGSDLAGGTAARCRLATPDGARAARRYWEVAAGLFSPAALAERQDVGSCPLNRFYQLARCLFFAAEAARQGGRRHFGALGIAPAATAPPIEAQTAAFAAGVLRPAHAGRVAVVHYETLAAALAESDDPRAQAVGRFVADRLPAPLAPARTGTVRELRKQAEAARRRRPRRDSP